MTCRASSHAGLPRPMKLLRLDWIVKEVQSVGFHKNTASPGHTTDIPRLQSVGSKVISGCIWANAIELPFIRAS